MMKANTARAMLVGILLILDVLVLIHGVEKEVEGARSAAQAILSYLDQFRPMHIAATFNQGEEQCWVIREYGRDGDAACEGEASPKGADLPICAKAQDYRCRDYHPTNVSGWGVKQIKVLFFALHHIWGGGWLFAAVWAVGSLALIAGAADGEAAVGALLFGPFAGTLIMVVLAWVAALVTYVFNAFLGLLLIINGFAAFLAVPIIAREWIQRGREVGELGERAIRLADSSETRPKP